MRYKVDKETILQIVILAQNIIKHKNDRYIRPGDVLVINKFIMRANFGSTRTKITMKDCEKIVNLARIYS